MDRASLKWQNYASVYDNEIHGNLDDDSDSDSDEISSEIEFQLYSQLHYASDLSHIFAKEQEFTESKSEENIAPSAGLRENNPKDNSFWLELTKTNDEEGTSEEKTDSVKLNRRPETSDDQSQRKSDSFTVVSSLDDNEDQASNASNDGSDFVPESWEIVDSVDSADSDDNNLNIHISRQNSEEEQDEIEDDRWTPGKGDKSSWKIDDKDRKMPTTGGRVRYYREEKSGVRCRNCNEVGHKAAACTEPKKQQACYMCGNRGHTVRDCPDSEGLANRGRWKECNRCQYEGHIQADCPDLWRQYHVTTRPGRVSVPGIPVQLNSNIHCYNCAESGHFGHECEEDGPQYFPLLPPLVHRYDRHAKTKEGDDLRKKLKRKNDAYRNKPDSNYSNKDSKNLPGISNKESKYNRTSAKSSRNIGNFLHSASRKVHDTVTNFFTKKKGDPKKRKWDQELPENGERFSKKRKKNSRNQNGHDHKISEERYRRVNNDHEKGHVSHRERNSFKKSRHIVFQEEDDTDFPRGGKKHFSNDTSQRKVYHKSTSWTEANAAKQSRGQKTGKGRRKLENESSVKDRGFRKRFRWKK